IATGHILIGDRRFYVAPDRRPSGRVVLPSDPEAALAGIALATIGKFTVEAREHPGVRPDGELGAGVDAHGVSRRARPIARERGGWQRDESGVDRAIGIELVQLRILLRCRTPIVPVSNFGTSRRRRILMPNVAVGAKRKRLHAEHRPPPAWMTRFPSSAF